MFKVISEKDYQTMLEVMEEQDKQIKELITLATDVLAMKKEVTEKYFDLLDVIAKSNISPEIVKNIDEIRSNMGSRA